MRFIDLFNCDLNSLIFILIALELILQNWKNKKHERSDEFAKIIA